jgi:hypothetical protein
MASTSKRNPVSEPEEDPDEDDELGDLEMGNPFMDLLVSSDGVTVGDSFAEIAKHLETQNKILIKILSTLVKK